MLDIQFPSQKPFHLQYLVCDINGTLTFDGKLIEGVQPILNELKNVLEIHLLSADTLGKADEIATLLDVRLTRIVPGNEARQKTAFVRTLGAKNVIALGQGANDALMLKQAALGICVLSPEGTAAAALAAADLVAPDILTALGLLQHPTRIVATLRK
jgi:P-type E1-E2 ATPase